jgi:hypothetical protein
MVKIAERRMLAPFPIVCFVIAQAEECGVQAVDGRDDQQVQDKALMPAVRYSQVFQPNPAFPEILNPKSEIRNKFEIQNHQNSKLQPVILARNKYAPRIRVCLDLQSSNDVSYDNGPRPLMTGADKASVNHPDVRGLQGK